MGAHMLASSSSSSDGTQGVGAAVGSATGASRTVTGWSPPPSRKSSSAVVGDGVVGAAVVGAAVVGAAVVGAAVVGDGVVGAAVVGAAVGSSGGSMLIGGEQLSNSSSLPSVTRILYSWFSFVVSSNLQWCVVRRRGGTTRQGH